MNSYRNKYSPISNFGKMSKPSSIDNPLSYCIGNKLDAEFLHGSNSYFIDGQNSEQCQWFLSDYCAQGWDNYCQIASSNPEKRFTNHMEFCKNQNSTNLTSGETLIRNTAIRKYLTNVHGGKKIYEPFDPNVVNSTIISKWVVDDTNPYVNNNHMEPVYMVDPKTINSDPIMDKILAKPELAMDILTNIYKNMKKNGTLKQLDKTKLGMFFTQNKLFFN